MMHMRRYFYKASDGRLFVAVADIQGQAAQTRRMMNAGCGSVTRKTRLLVIVPTATSASVAAKTDMESDVLSAPRIAPGAGSYIVYVTGFKMFGMGRNVEDRDGVSSGQRDVYAFTRPAL